jgi:t-SNARE complex subunit (syntaxin)
METRLAKLEAIIPTLATREDLAKQTTETMDRMDRLVAGLRADFDRKFSEINNAILDLRKDFDRKFILCVSIQITALFAIVGLLSKIANIF